MNEAHLNNSRLHAAYQTHPPTTNSDEICIAQWQTAAKHKNTIKCAYGHNQSVKMHPEVFLQNLQTENIQNASELHSKQLCFSMHKSWKCTQNISELLQPLWWRCVDCVIQHERDVHDEQKICMWHEQAIGEVWDLSDKIHLILFYA